MRRAKQLFDNLKAILKNPTRAEYRINRLQDSLTVRTH